MMKQRLNTNQAFVLNLLQVLRAPKFASVFSALLPSVDLTWLRLQRSKLPPYN